MLTAVLKTNQPEFSHLSGNRFNVTEILGDAAIIVVNNQPKAFSLDELDIQGKALVEAMKFDGNCRLLKKMRTVMPVSLAYKYKSNFYRKSLNTALDHCQLVIL